MDVTMDGKSSSQSVTDWDGCSIYREDVVKGGRLRYKIKVRFPADPSPVFRLSQRNDFIVNDFTTLDPKTGDAAKGASGVNVLPLRAGSLKRDEQGRPTAEISADYLDFAPHLSNGNLPIWSLARHVYRDGLGHGTSYVRHPDLHCEVGDCSDLVDPHPHGLEGSLIVIGCRVCVERNQLDKCGVSGAVLRHVCAEWESCPVHRDGGGRNVIPPNDESRALARACEPFVATDLSSDWTSSKPASEVAVEPVPLTGYDMSIPNAATLVVLMSRLATAAEREEERIRGFRENFDRYRARVEAAEAEKQGLEREKHEAESSPAGLQPTSTNLDREKDARRTEVDAVRDELARAIDDYQALETSHKNAKDASKNEVEKIAIESQSACSTRDDALAKSEGFEKALDKKRKLRAGK